MELAVANLEEFDPLTMKEPEGWIRHIPSMRRRPDGNKQKEYIRK